MNLNKKSLGERCLGLLSSMRFWACLIWAVLLISLIPLLDLARYSHSCADDYSYGLLTHQAWVNSHDLFAVLRAACQKVALNYMDWQGSFSAMFIFALQPAIFGEQFYWIGTWVLLGSLIFGTVFLCRSFFGKLLGKMDLGMLFSGLLLLLQIQLMPSPVNSLYWWNGASYYTLFYSLMLVQMGMCIRLLTDPGPARGRVALGCLLGLLLGGGNYVTALLTFEMSLLFLLFSFLLRKRRGSLLLIFAVFCASFLISVAAPGNAVRQTNFTQNTVWGAILSSYVRATPRAREWTRAPLLMALLFMVPLIWRLCREKLPNGLKLLPAAGLLFVLYSAYASAYTPPQFAMPGYPIPGRIDNICFFLWYTVAFLAEAVVIAAVQGLLPCLGWERGLLPKVTPVILAAMVFCGALYTVHHWRAREYDYLSSTLAMSCLRDGSAAQFDAEADARIALLQSGQSRVILAPYSVKPSMLFFDDIAESPEDWRNGSVAQFYGLEEVSKLPEPGE